MIDDLLEIGGGFDYITPAIALGHEAAGQWVHVAVPIDEYPACVFLLASCGIDTHEPTFGNGEAVFSIAADDRDLVTDLLGLEW